MTNTTTTLNPAPRPLGAPAQDRSDVNDAYRSETARMARIAEVIGAARPDASPIARCIPPLLIALDWFGAPRTLVGSLPGDSVDLGLDDLRRLLTELGFASEAVEARGTPDEIDRLPVGTVLIRERACHVYLGRLHGRDWWHDGDVVGSETRVHAGDVLLRIQHDSDHVPIDAPRSGWFMSLVARARGELGGIALVSLIVNVLALAISLFTMTVYNHVIPSGATTTLWALGSGALIAVLGGWGLRLARARLLARLGAWAGANIGPTVMRKTLGLPLDVSARLGVNNNLTRMRSIEGARQFLGGTGGTALIDYPFVVVFLFTIALLGGWIVFVPLVALGLFYGLARGFGGYVQARARKVGRATTALQEEISAGAQRLRSLQGIAGTDLWLRRLGEVSAQAAEANRDHALAMSRMQTVGQAMSQLTVLATLAVGISLVLTASMNAGQLIATMMLIWRVTTPAQQAFASSLRLGQLASATRQLDSLMASAGEMQNPKASSPVEPMAPKLGVDRLFYRYGAMQEPALNGVSFDVEPGQRLAVVGPNGAGKTTLLQSLAGIRAIQNGRISIAGRDIRQFDPSDYRAWVGVLGQNSRGLPLPLGEFLRLGHPGVSDQRLQAVLARVGGDTWWELLGARDADHALTLPIDPWQEGPDALRARYVIGLAEALVDDPPLLLLDDPLRDRDPQLDPLLQQLLDALHGNTTVVLATHRADLIQKADLIAVLDNGNLIHFGPVGTPGTTDPNASEETPS